MATYKEAVPFLNSIEFIQVSEKPFPVYKKERLFLIISGIGKTNSAIASSYLISNYEITQMFNLGSAGSTTTDFNIGDIFQIAKSIEYDCRKTGEPRHKYFTPDTLSEFSTATLSTHDIPVVSADDRDKISNISELIDMEGSAFIQASQAFGAKAYLYKIVSDTPGNTEISDIIDNIKNTREALFNFFMKGIYQKYLV